jgi:hypothetical protein
MRITLKRSIDKQLRIYPSVTRVRDVLVHDPVQQGRRDVTLVDIESIDRESHVGRRFGRYDIVWCYNSALLPKIQIALGEPRGCCQDGQDESGTQHCVENVVGQGGS